MNKLISIALTIGLLMSIIPIFSVALAADAVLTGMEVSVSKNEMISGDTAQINVELFDEDNSPFAGTAELSYTSINPYAVSVAASGLLTANNSGYSRIIVTASSGGKVISKTISITVSIPNGKITFENTENGKLPSGFTTAQQSLVYVTDEMGQNSHKSVLIWDNSTTLMANLFYAGTSSNQKTVDFSVYSTGESVSLRVLNSTNSIPANTAFQIRITDDGLYYYSGTAYVKLYNGVVVQKNKWNKVHIEIINNDKTNGSADIYVNGILKGTAKKSAGTWGTATDKIDTVNFISAGSGPANDKFFIDNFSFVDGIVPVEVNSNPYIESASLKASKSKLSIGESINLSVENICDSNLKMIDNNSCSIKFYSETPELATINEQTGLICPLAEGIAKFTAAVEHNGITIASNTIAVEIVEGEKLGSFKLDTDKYALKQNEESILKCTAYNILGDEITSGIHYSFNSSNEEVIKVGVDGKVAAVSPGIAIVTVVAQKDDVTLSKQISLQVNNNSEVVVVQESSPYEAHFSSIINVPARVYGGSQPNGKLLTVYYKNTLHVPSSPADPFGTICVVESTDNGVTWSQPKEILSPAKLLEYGIGTQAKQVEARDPNFALLNDGTVLLTFWTRNYNTDSSVSTYLIESKDGGATWKAPLKIPCTTLNSWYAKRGNIAVFDDDEILVPVYGCGSTYPNDQTAVNILGKRDIGGNWVWTKETTLARSSVLGKNINEVALAAVEGDTVYAFAREPGYVWKSEDRGSNWTIIGDQGTLHQPGLIKIDSNRIFCTWARPLSPRPVYGKMFYLNQGWDETQEKLIYNYTAGWNDMGDPSAVLTNDGRLLTIYYVTALRTISGTFTELSDWELLETSGKGEQWKLFEDNFEDNAAGEDYNNNYFSYVAGENSTLTIREEAGNKYLQLLNKYGSTLKGMPQMISVDAIGGNYATQFDFRMKGDNQQEVWQDLHVSMQYGDEDFTFHLNSNQIMLKDKDGIEKASASKAFASGTWYSFKSVRSGSILYAKVWKNGTVEPETWDIQVSDSKISPIEAKLCIAYDANDTTGKSLDMDNLVISKQVEMNLNNTLLDSEVGSSVQLKLTVLPGYAKELVKWSSSDSSIATVSDGLVNCLAPGAVTITVKLGNVTKTCIISIKGSPFEISDQGEAWKFFKDDFEGYNTDQVYNNSNFLVVNSVKVKSEEKNKFLQFNAKTASGAAEQAQLYSQIPYSGNYTAQFDFRFGTVGGSYEEMYVSMQHNSGTYVAHIQPGKLIFNANGTRVIDINKSFTRGVWYTYKSARLNGKIYVKTWLKGEEEPLDWDYVVVNDGIISGEGKLRLSYYSQSPTGVNFDVDNLTLSKRTNMTLSESAINAQLNGQLHQIKVTFDPDISTMLPVTEVTWMTSDTGVATVNNGLIESKGVGTANITATLGSITKTCAVTVTDNSTKNRIVTFKDWDGSILKTETVIEGNGATAPQNPARAGYLFTGWDKSFDIVTSDLAVTAQYSVISPEVTSPEVTNGGTVAPDKTDVEISVNKNTAVAVVTIGGKSDNNGNEMASIAQSHVGDAIRKLLEEAEKQVESKIVELEIKVNTPPNTKQVETNIPQEAIKLVAEKDVKAFKITTAVASVSFDKKALSGLLEEAGGEVKITISQVQASALSKEEKQIVGDRPVFSFSVTGENKAISQFDGRVSVSIPYNLKDGEDKNVIVIYCINEEGKTEIVSNCIYDPTTQTVTFKTSHFSKYAVGYNKVNFKDVVEDEWYSEAVAFMAARGIVTGTDNGNYSPDNKLSRGEIIVMVLRVNGIEADKDAKDNFDDAGNTYYTGYLAAAKRLGLSEGVGNNMYAPDKDITRQEMFTLLYNVIKLTGELPEVTSGKGLAEFKDSDQIAPWAKEAMSLFIRTGIISGSDSMLTPTGTANRAQAAQLLYNLLTK